ncbi:MAG TPA: SPOR domain-containing protein [Tabrizicola sp.]|nr:SPOR domain-containing protein [Tabrizicola sp.]
MTRGTAFALAVALIGGAAAARDLIQPAELPPASYAGQQYVDSKGCLFMRAGQAGKELWLPRVTREGVPVCGNPRSGIRVPVVEEGASVAVDPAPSAAVTAPADDTAAGGFYVAVGSFGVAANADKAVARLLALNYPFARGRLPDGSTTLVTVFAGPFGSAAAAAKAQAELHGAGFPDAIMVGP